MLRSHTIAAVWIAYDGVEFRITAFMMIDISKLLAQHGEHGIGIMRCSSFVGESVFFIVLIVVLSCI
jgi:hypothetical protein